MKNVRLQNALLLVTFALARVLSAGTETVRPSPKLVHIGVKQGSDWAVGDEICVSSGKSSFGCSKVLKRKPREVQAKLFDPDNRIGMGKKLVVTHKRVRLASLDTANYQVTGMEKRPASESPRTGCSLHSHGQLVVMPQFSFMKIAATDKQSGGSGTFSPGLSPGLDLRWNTGMHKGFEPRFFFNLTHIELAPGDSKTITNAAQTLWAGGVGFALHPLPGDRVMISVFGGLQKEIFFRALTPSKLVLDGIAMPSLSVQVSTELYRAGRLSLGLELGGTYYLSGQKDDEVVRNGTEYHAKAVGAWDLDSVRLVGGISAGKQSFNASFVDQERTTVMFELGIGWKAR